MDRDEFIRQLRGTPSQATTNPPAAPFGPENLIPATQEELNRQTQAYNESRIRSERSAAPTGTGAYIMENKRPGVPLDIGASEDIIGNNPWVRMMVARRKLESDQKDFLEQWYGKGTVRRDKAGQDWIVEVLDPQTGQPREIKLNEEAMTVADLGALLASAGPEVLGGLGGMGAGRMLPGIGKAKGAGGFLRDLLFGSAGAQTAGGASEALGRAETGTPVEAGEIASRRIRNVPLDLALGYLTAGILKGGKGVINFGKSPFSFARTDIQNEGLAAARRISEKTGINLEYDPGEATGWAGLIQSRKYLESHPAGSASQKAFKREQEAKVDAFKDYLFGGAPSDEEAGRALMKRLQDIRTTAEEGVSTIREATATGAESKLRGMIGAGEELPTVTGEKVRTAILDKASAIKTINRENYAKVYELPESKEAIIPTKGLQKTLDDIKANLPDRAKQIEEVFYDQYGNPMTKSSEGRELLPGWTPGELKQFLGGGFDPQMPLNKMVEMRALIYDKLNTGEALPGIPSRYLKDMGKAITAAIDEGVSKLPGGELKARVLSANDYYKKEVLKLSEAGVEDLFATVKEGTRFVEPQNVINRLKADPAKYKRTMDFIGPTSPEAEAIRQSVKTDLVLDSASGLDATRIDGAKLLKNLNELRTGKNTREIFNDVFGGSFGDIQKEAATLGAAQGSIPVEEALQWIKAGPTVGSLKSILAAEARQADLLKNKVLSDLTAGKLDTTKLNPEEVLTVIERAPKSNVDQLMGWVRTDPVLQANTERKMIENLFQAAGGAKAKGSKLQKLLEDKTYSDKVESVVGPENMALLKDFIAYDAPREVAEEIAGGTGMLVKGTAIGKFMGALPLIGKSTEKAGEHIEEFIKLKALSFALAHPLARKWLSSNPPVKEIEDLAKGIVISTPFLRAMAEELPETKAGVAVQAIKQMVERYTTPPEAAAPEPAMSREDFMRQLQ